MRTAFARNLDAAQYETEYDREEIICKMRRHSHDDVFRLQDQNAEYHSREKLIDKLFKAAVREREQESRKHYGGHFSELQKSPQNNAAEQKFFKNCRQQRGTDKEINIKPKAGFERNIAAPRRRKAEGKLNVADFRSETVRQGHKDGQKSADEHKCHQYFHAAALPREKSSAVDRSDIGREADDQRNNA